MVIFNKYKDILEYFINYWDPAFPDWLGQIDEKLCNVSKSEGSLIILLEEFCLDKDILDSSKL